MDEKRIKEVFSDAAFTKSILEMDEPGQVQAALKGKGLDFSLDDIGMIKNGLVAMQNSDGELDIDQLDNVAGGFAITATLGVIATIVGIGGGIAGAAASAASVVSSIKNSRW